MQDTTTSPLFSATLRPDRSLPAAGGWIGLVLAGIVGAPFLVAMPEFILPGLAAYGLAGTGLGVLNLRQARRRKLSQTVTLWSDQLEILTSAPGAERQMRRFEIGKVRLRLKRDAYERTTAIFLRHDEDEFELGQFLSLEDRSSFAQAFGGALRRARKGS